MNYPINYKDISRKTEFYPELAVQYDKARTFLEDFDWCKTIKGCSLYVNLGKVFCIFLFEIENSASNEDNFLWVIVGDLPSMYLDVFGCKTTKEVVECYVELGEDWITKVRFGDSIEDCYPFASTPTIELADLLDRRISFMKNTLVDNMDVITAQTF